MKYISTKLTLFLFWFSNANAIAGEKPNILFLSVDDLKPLIGAYGFDEVPTPNMDELASRGTVMLNNHCQQAICAPSRMSMFTGLRPDSTKVWDLRTSIQDANPNAVTMQQWFKEAGYTTAGAGKIMHGARSNHPESWSVPYLSHRKLPFNSNHPVPAHDNAYYQNEKSHQVYDKLNEKGIKHWKARFDCLKDNDAMPSTEALDLPDDAYVDGALTVWAVDQLETYAKSGENFFLTVGFCKPHLHFVAPKKYWDMIDPEIIELAEFRERAKNSPSFAYHQFGELRSYTDIPNGFNNPVPDEKQRELIHGYYACVAFIDAQIGKILETLDDTGLAENTIVVLWGDHGYHLGDHGMWNKHSNFEQATFAPLIISAPGYSGNQKTTGMTEMVDTFPTLVELAGLEAPYELEGDSLVPVMKDPEISVKEYAVSQYPRSGGRMGYALRTDRYRLVMWMKYNWRTTMPFNSGALEAVELYDYEKDPLETINVADNPEYADVVEDMRKKMGQYFAQYEEQPETVATSSGTGIRPDKDGNIINLKNLDPSTMELHFASVEKDNDELKIEFKNSPKWPSVDFVTTENEAWDLTGFQQIDIQLTNDSPASLKTTAYVTNAGDSHLNKKRNGTTKEIGGGGNNNAQYQIQSQRLSSRFKSTGSP